MTALSSPSSKYTLESGRVLISGRQALVRLPLSQRHALTPGPAGHARRDSALG